MEMFFVQPNESFPSNALICFFIYSDLYRHACTYLLKICRIKTGERAAPLRDFITAGRSHTQAENIHWLMDEGMWSVKG